MKKIIIAAVKSWNISNARIFQKENLKKYQTTIYSQQEDLTYQNIKKINPDYIFIPHWSWIIPSEIYSNFKCIIFHTSDLPYGRGGSPIQNQIIRGIKESKVCAIQCNSEIDAGDVYCKENVYLGRGNADEILIEISDIIFKKMIPHIIENEPASTPQLGEATTFKRRNKLQSNIQMNTIENLDLLYDFIRMLDGEDYPPAYIELNNLKIYFSNVTKRGNRLEGRFEIHES
ncbi:formyltransferase family protein [Desulfovibrio sp. UCD-KL4C]|uniref:formyltransferase family protein n=1 Tax=Desulfovibrio sp. UCD-KL4C TaxID=2578120 RepID=UPI0025C24FA9|nr:formyltransferase family protein [Desulfovibrio sp. UCD-KL4C]